jgi:hypothetical protein
MGFSCCDPHVAELAKKEEEGGGAARTAFRYGVSQVIIKESLQQINVSARPQSATRTSGHLD